MSSAEKPSDANYPEHPPQGRPIGGSPNRESEHVITAKDAGWRSKSLYVLPMTFVPVDPPEPVPKDRPRKELPPTGAVWRLPPVFAKPITFVTLDPPEPRKKNRSDIDGRE